MRLRFSLMTFSDFIFGFPFFDFFVNPHLDGGEWINAYVDNWLNRYFNILRINSSVGFACYVVRLFEWFLSVVLFRKL